MTTIRNCENPAHPVRMSIGDSNREPLRSCGDWIWVCYWRYHRLAGGTRRPKCGWIPSSVRLNHRRRSGRWDSCRSNQCSRLMPTERPSMCQLARSNHRWESCEFHKKRLAEWFRPDRSLARQLIFRSGLQKRIHRSGVPIFFLSVIFIPISFHSAAAIARKIYLIEIGNLLPYL